MYLEQRQSSNVEVRVRGREIAGKLALISADQFESEGRKLPLLTRTNKQLMPTPIPDSSDPGSRAPSPCYPLNDHAGAINLGAVPLTRSNDVPKEPDPAFRST